MKRFITITILSLISILSYGQEITRKQAYPDSICVNGVTINNWGALLVSSGWLPIINIDGYCFTRDKHTIAYAYYYAFDNKYPYDGKIKDQIYRRLITKLQKYLKEKGYRITGYNIGVDSYSYHMGQLYRKITGIFIYIENIEYRKQQDYKEIMSKKAATAERKNKLNEFDKLIESL